MLSLIVKYSNIKLRNKNLSQTKIGKNGLLSIPNGTQNILWETLGLIKISK